MLPADRSTAPLEPDTTEEGRPLPDERELVRLLGTRFIERRDVKALQSNAGHWFAAKCKPCTDSDAEYCPHLPMKMSDFRAHLAGEITMGHYLVNPETQTCKFFAFDIDLMKPREANDKLPAFQPVYGGSADGPWPPPDAVPFNPREAWLQPDHPAQEEMTIALRTLADALAQSIERRLNIPVAIMNSGGKGLHVYGFTGSIPAEAAQALAVEVLEGFGCFVRSKGNVFWRHMNADKFGTFQYIEIEIFPKQTSVNPGGYGNLMKVPLGVHRKTGGRSYFISTRNGVNKLVEMDPMRVLEGDLPWE